MGSSPSICSTLCSEPQVEELSFAQTIITRKQSARQIESVRNKDTRLVDSARTNINFNLKDYDFSSRTNEVRADLFDQQVKIFSSIEVLYYPLSKREIKLNKCFLASLAEFKAYFFIPLISKGCSLSLSAVFNKTDFFRVECLFSNILFSDALKLIYSKIHNEGGDHEKTGLFHLKLAKIGEFAERSDKSARIVEFLHLKDRLTLALGLGDLFFKDVEELFLSLDQGKITDFCYKISSVVAIYERVTVWLDDDVVELRVKFMEDKQMERELLVQDILGKSTEINCFRFVEGELESVGLRAGENELRHDLRSGSEECFKLY